MKEYVGHVVLSNKLTRITFKTDKNPVKYLWGKYGMSVYILKIDGVEEGAGMGEAES